VRRRGKSPWLEAARKRPLETMLPCVAERIAEGEHPLEVWAQQQCVSLKTIGRRTKIDMYRLIDVVHGQATLSEDELAAVARELRIAPHLLPLHTPVKRPAGGAL
jgi:hypothetical protein